ncbi:MAG: cobalamin B12-binding domain-containing protein [Roseinatronobacter sp.]
MNKSVSAKSTASIDPQIFAHKALLFEEKRRVLPASVVEGLAKQVVTHVAETMAERVAAHRARIDPDRVARFCDLLLTPGKHSQALAFITALRDDGATLEDVYLGYIGAAARMLGERWEADAVTPLQVTNGAGTVYALMRALRRTQTVIPPLDTRHAALFASVPGEQHGIGVTMAADMFRQAGWDIDLQLGLDHPALLAHVTRTRPRVIGLSLSTHDRLPELVRAVVGLRLVVQDAVIGIAQGGDLTAADLQRVADVDLIFNDAPSAIATLTRWLQEPTIPLHAQGAPS